MAIAHVQSFSEGSGDGNGFTSGSFDDTGANFRHVFLCQQGAQNGVVSDDDLNTWTQALQEVGGFAASLDSWYAYNITGGSGSTIGVTGTSTLPAIAVSSFSGVKSSADPLSQQSASSNLFSGTIQAGSVTPPANDQLVLAGLGALADDDPPSIDSGFTLESSIGATGSLNLSVASSRLIQTTAGAVNPEYTYNGTENIAINVTFDAAAGGTQSYSYSATGGLSLGGTSVRAKVSAPATAGGVQLGGTAASAKVKVVSAAGGLQLGGTAERANVHAVDAAGGLNISGAAGYSSSGTQSYSYSATGGLTMAGTAAYARVTIRVPAGGLQMGGAAAVSTHESTRTVTPTGGIILSGAASVQTLVAGAMLDELLRDARRRGYVRTLYGRG